MTTLDTQAFHWFEHAGWETAARAYHESWTALTMQAVAPLLDAAHVGRGTRLLDVATGPGHVAGLAAERGASAVGVDFAAAMLTLAREQYPYVQFGEGDATALPFPSLSFDAVVSNFGILHFARPEIALGEAYRVLRPSGRVAFTTWATTAEAVGLKLIYDAIEQYGNLNAPLPPGPPFFRFSDPQQCRLVLRETGFVNPHVEQVAMRWRLPLPDGLFDAFFFGTARTGPLLSAQSPEALGAIREAVREASRAFAHGDHIDVAMPCVLASGAK